MAMLDSLVALRVMYLLVLPFKKWPAFKQGIIDAEGNTLKTKNNSSDWTMLHRLVARIKKIIGSVPGGKSIIGSMVAAYALVKEQYEGKYEYNNLDELFEWEYNTLTEEKIQEGTKILEEIVKMMEDGAGGAAGSGVAVGGAGIAPKGDGSVEPIVRSGSAYKRKNEILRRTSSPQTKGGMTKKYRDFINGG